MCQCLEFQFDAVISDRRMILHCMHLLANLLPDLEILLHMHFGAVTSIDFFLKCFAVFAYFSVCVSVWSSSLMLLSVIEE